MSRAEELLAAIRAHCLECSGGSKAEIRRCRVTDCALYPYRRNEQKNINADVDGQMSIYDYKGVS